VSAVQRASEASMLDGSDRARLVEILGEYVRFDEPLAPYTSWKIGGPADAFATVRSEDELAAIMRTIFKRKLPWFVLGSGSNLLVGDGGIRGIVLRLAGSFAEVAVRPPACPRSSRKRPRRARSESDRSREFPEASAARSA
jgi:hypothetical protein